MKYETIKKLERITFRMVVVVSVITLAIIILGLMFALSIITPFIAADILYNIALIGLILIVVFSNINLHLMRQ